MTSRAITPYDPLLDAAVRHPDWTIVFRDLCGIRVVYSRQQKVILLDKITFAGAEEMAYARAVAAIDLELLQSQGQLTQEQVEPAAWLAKMRLDEPSSRVA